MPPSLAWIFHTLPPPPPFRSPYPSIYIQLTHTHTQISSDSTGRPVQTRRFLLLVAWLNHEQFSHATLLQSIIGPKDYLKAGAPTQKPSVKLVSLSHSSWVIFSIVPSLENRRHTIHNSTHSSSLFSLSLTQTCIYIYVHAHTHARMHAHTHIPTPHTHITHTHTHVYIYMHAHTHTHARTRTHPHHIRI